MLSIRKVEMAMLLALVQEHNKNLATIAAAGSKYHKDITTWGTTGNFTAPSAAARLAVTATATDEATGVLRANELKNLLVYHLRSTAAHKAADTTTANTLAAVADATADASVITLATAIQTAWNAHDGDTTYHITADTTDDGTSIGSSAANARTSLNAIFTAYNAHIQSAPAGAYINLVDP